MIALHKQRKRRFSEGRIAEVSVYGQICGHAKIAKITKSLVNARLQGFIWSE
jgi:hypothetical protein